MRTNRREHSEHRQPLHLQPRGWRKTISTKSGREIVLSRGGDAQISKRRNWGPRYPRSSFVPSKFPAALRYHSSRRQENRNLLILAPIGWRAMEYRTRQTVLIAPSSATCGMATIGTLRIAPSGCLGLPSFSPDVPEPG